MAESHPEITGRKTGVSLNNPIFQRSMILFGAGAAGIGVLGLAGLAFNITILRNVFPGYQTMALSTAVLCILFGTILIIYAIRQFQGKVRVFVQFTVASIAVIEAIELPLNIAGHHFIAEALLIRIGNAIAGQPTSGISPGTLILVILSAIGFFTLFGTPDPEKGRHRDQDAISITGLTVALVSFTIILSYAYGTPFLYGTNIVPIAILTALALFCTGAGLASAAGPESFPFRYFGGGTATARLLRAILPLTLIIIFAEALIVRGVSAFSGPSETLLISVCIVIFALLAGYVVMSAARGLGEALEEEEQKRKAAEEKLARKNDNLTATGEELRANIDELSRSDQKLRESEEKYRSLFENLLEGYAYCRMIYDDAGHPDDFIYLEVNPAFDEIIGEKTVTGKRVTEIFPGIKEAFPKLFEIYGRVAMSGKPETFALDFKPSGKWLYISVYSPAKEHFVAIFEDITERRNAEAALKESNEKITEHDRFLQRLIETIPNPIFYKDKNGIYIGCNTAFEGYIGISKDKLVGKSVYDIAPKDLADVYYAQDRKLFDNPGTQIYESAVKYVDGTVHDVIFTKATFTSLTGNVEGLVGVMIDITERKKAEKELAALYRELEDRVKARTFDLIKINETLKKEIVQSRQVEEKLHITNEKLEAAIEELKATDKTLKESEERYRLITETVTDYIYTVTVDNGRAINTTHGEGCVAVTGYTCSEFIANPSLWIEIVAEDDRPSVIDHAQKALTEKKSRIIEHRIIRKDGVRRWVRNTSVPRYDPQGRLVAYDGLIQDITERKQLEEKILKSLKEKEILLEEIHHRVKNNLQIIASLLNLQIRKTTDPPTIEALKDSQNRVRSMALVHEHLYRGKDFSHIDLESYLRALGMVLFNSYSGRNQDIRFDLNIHDIYVDTNIAIPLGLITNELITNSLKYAFREKKDGNVSVYATEDPTTLTFVVADNGIGLPPDITLENQTSLGFQLVSSLTDQLNGTVVIDRTGGTKFTFTFPKTAERSATSDL